MRTVIKRAAITAAAVFAAVAGPGAGTAAANLPVDAGDLMAGAIGAASAIIWQEPWEWAANADCRNRRNLHRRFFTGGTHGGPRRSLAEAAKVCALVPRSVRAHGAESVNSYLKDKHFSHKTAHQNGGSNGAGNLIIEPAEHNLRRGGKNMSRTDRIVGGFRRVGSSIAGAAKFMPKSVGSGAVAAGVINGGITAIEARERYETGEITGERYAALIGKDVGKGALIGGVFTAAGVVTMALFPPSAAVIAPAMMATGVAGTAVAVYEMHTVLKEQDEQ